MLYRLGELFNVPVYETPVGFKYVAPLMTAEQALMDMPKMIAMPTANAILIVTTPPVLIRYGGTVVLVTACMSKKPTGVSACASLS